MGELRWEHVLFDGPQCVVSWLFVCPECGGELRLIDLPAKEGYRRKNDGTPLSYLELREKYYLVINGNNTLHLNGFESIEELASQIETWVLDRI